MAIPVPVNGYFVFDLQGDTGAKIAVNFAKNVAIATDGEGKFQIYAAGVQLPVKLAPTDTLALLLAGL